MRDKFTIGILATAQFIMVLDSSVMNVSISQIVADLGTTIQGVQFAITLYTLVMAAFMLLGAKLGDIWGRDRAFALGLVIYGLGSLTTALSPNLAVLLLGWSLVEGLGAVLVMPSIAALTATHYEGKERALAYGLIGGVAAAAIAAGPLIGGWVTTAFTWRLVFAAETVIVLVVLVLRRRMNPSPRPSRTPRLDVVGATLSAVGLGLIVTAVLQSSTWGWVTPRNPPTIAGVEITPLGFSVVPFLILLGFAVLTWFLHWEQHRARRGEDVLLDTRLLRIPPLRAGLTTLTVQQLVLLGTFFVLPVYLQVVLGLNAFETGKRLIPMSVAMFAAALLGPRAAARRSPKRVAQAGLVTLSIGSVVLLSTIDVELNRVGFAVGLAVFGVGIGLLASQLGNVIMSAVAPRRVNEAGGLQGTAQNLGASLGTALLGAILLGGLTNGFVERVTQEASLPADVRTSVSSQAAASGMQVVTLEQAYEIALDAGLAPEHATSVAAAYGQAQLDGLRGALGAGALVAVVGLWFTRRLPSRPPAGDTDAAQPPPDPEAAAGEQLASR